MQTCQNSRFGRESPALKANSDLPSAFCFISQSPAFHKKTILFFEKVVFHLQWSCQIFWVTKIACILLNCALVTRRDCLIWMLLWWIFIWSKPFPEIFSMGSLNFYTAICLAIYLFTILLFTFYIYCKFYNDS